MFAMEAIVANRIGRSVHCDHPNGKPLCVDNVRSNVDV